MTTTGIRRIFIKKHKSKYLPCKYVITATRIQSKDHRGGFICIRSQNDEDFEKRVGNLLQASGLKEIEILIDLDDAEDISRLIICAAHAIKHRELNI